MAVASTTTDYTGRLKDISILQYPDATGTEAQTVLPSFGKHTRFCAGVQKLVQKYAVILLTNVGSQLAYPEFGTSFLYTMQAGISPVDRIRAAQIFSLASYKAVSTLRAYQEKTPGIPSDESIVRATLQNISLYGGYAAFDVVIHTEAGDTIDFVVPLPK